MLKLLEELGRNKRDAPAIDYGLTSVAAIVALTTAANSHSSLFGGIAGPIERAPQALSGSLEGGAYKVAHDAVFTDIEKWGSTSLDRPVPAFDRRHWRCQTAAFAILLVKAVAAG